jgi:zinc protease
LSARILVLAKDPAYKENTVFKKFFGLFPAKLSLCAFVIVVLLSCSSIDQSFNRGKNPVVSEDHFKQLSGSQKALEQTNSSILWPHEKSDLLPDPTLVFKKLPNGFRYVLMENHYPKNRVSMHLYVLAGSTYESDTQQGLAHFLEHMLFDGSTHFQPEELVKYFQSIGMKFGPDANAHTGFDRTVYDMLLAEGDGESLENGLVVMKDFAEGALLLPSQVEKERRVVLSEMRTRDSSSYRTYISTINFEFPDAIISKRLPIGKEEVLKSTERRDLKKFYDTWYRPEKMILVLAGDFDAKLAATLIDNKFSSLAPRAPPGIVPEFGDISHKGVKPFYHFEKESGNTTVSIEAVKKVPSEADSLDFQKKRLTKDIANQIVKHRLDTLARESDTPFTSASISSGNFLHQIKYAEISADCNPENWKDSLSLIEQTLRKALKYGFTESELARVKKDFLSELDNAVKEASTRNSHDLARKIIWSLNTDRVFMSPEQKKELLASIVNSVTLKNVHDAFKEIWPSDDRLVLVTGNAKLTDINMDPETQILDTYFNSRSVTVSRPIKKSSVIFPYLPEPEKEGRIIRTNKIPDLGIVQVDFKNNVRLNLKKTDFKANQVIVNLAFGRGKSCEPLNMPGLALLTANVMNKSGLGVLKREEIERALSGKNTSVTFRVGEDRFLLKGETVTREVPLLFELLYAHFVDPGFRKEAYERSLKLYRQKYMALSSSIDGAMELSGVRFLAGGDNRFGLTDFKNFNKLTIDDVRSWITQSMGNDDVELSVVGDFDMESTIKLASKYFGSLSLKPIINQPKEKRLPVFPVGQSKAISASTKIQKGLIVVAYPTEDLWDISRTRRLSVLSAIISDRLREQIREKLGAAYTTFAFNRPSRVYPGYGVLQAWAYVDPQEADGLIKNIKKISSDLVKDGLTRDELHRAIAPSLTSIKDMLRKNTYWLDTVLTGSEKYPQQIDWSRTINKDYASITQEEVSNLAEKYLDNHRTATIIVRPGKPQP